ncbi:MAG: formyltetrahydrofolate deformylase [Candidatus Marinamargulisbacteria bacterium]
MNLKTIVIILSCKDQPGIVAQLSGCLFEHNVNIISADQYSSELRDGDFFIRLEVDYDIAMINEPLMEEDLSRIASEFSASLQLFPISYRMKMGILVSKEAHCLHDLLYRWESGDLNIEIPFVISNHERARKLVEHFDIPFYYLPAHTGDRMEKEILEIIAEKSDFLVLARYMQILSKSFIDSYANDIINIHHSFLPSFKGGNPYKQAFDRGVKIIGATAHFVTEHLDEGPIIKQMVNAVSHADTVESMKKKGRNMEKIALAEALHDYVEHRVIRYGKKAIIL